MQYDVRAFSSDYYHIWNFIVGVQYVTVGSFGMRLSEVMEQLSENVELKKPFVILGVNQFRAAEYQSIVAMGLFDYEFGV